MSESAQGQQPNSVPPEGKVSKKWGIGLVLLGTTLELVGVFSQRAFGLEAIFVGIGMLLCPSGMFSYIAAKGYKWRWRIVWSLIALVPVLGPAYAILGILLGETTKKRSIELLAVIGMLGVSILASIAIRDLRNYNKKGVQSEAKENLNSIFMAEMAFQKIYKRFGTLDEIGFKLEGANHRYTYRIDASGKPGTFIPAGNGSRTSDNTVMPAGYSAAGFTATATANIDSDLVLDQWHVNDAKQGLDKADVNDITD